MSRTHRPAVEHRTVAQEAGLGRLSLVSVVAGTLCAYGTFAIVGAAAGSLLAAVDVDTEELDRDHDEQVGADPVVAPPVTTPVDPRVHHAGHQR